MSKDTPVTDRELLKECLLAFESTRSAYAAREFLKMRGTPAKGGYGLAVDQLARTMYEVIEKHLAAGSDWLEFHRREQEHEP